MTGQRDDPLGKGGLESIGGWTHFLREHTYPHSGCKCEKEANKGAAPAVLMAEEALWGPEVAQCRSEVGHCIGLPGHEFSLSLLRL